MTVVLRRTVHRCRGLGRLGTNSSGSAGNSCMTGINRSKVVRKSCDLLEAFGLSIYLTNKVSGRLSIKEPRLATGLHSFWRSVQRGTALSSAGHVRLTAKILEFR